MEPIELWTRQLGDWRAFSLRHGRAYDEFVGKLPEPTAEPHFRLARSLLERARKPQRPLKGGTHDVSQYEPAAEGARALALDDELHGWSSQVAALRERGLAAPAGEAPGLAREMSRCDGPPWILWACAARAPRALLGALLREGVRHRAGIPLGAMGLQAAMGFSGLPVGSWVGRLARACDPSGFCADSATMANGSFLFLQDVALRRPKAFPDLPIRQGCGDNYSRAVDAMLACATPPSTSLLFSALGHASNEKRPAEPELLAPLLDDPFLRATLSARSGGLPAGFDRQWPLVRAFAASWGEPHELALRVRGLGADVRDVCEGQAVWEIQVEPTCETGSEGLYAPITPQLLEALFEMGADFGSTGLGQAWSRRATDRALAAKLARDMSLMDFYALVLPVWRVESTRADLAPWIARGEARGLDASIPRSTARSAARAL